MSTRSDKIRAHLEAQKREFEAMAEIDRTADILALTPLIFADDLDEDMLGDCDECREWRILMRKNEDDPESRWLCKMCMETCDE